MMYRSSALAQKKFVTHFPLIVSYRSVKAKFVGVVPSHFAIVEVNMFFVSEFAIAAHHISQSSAFNHTCVSHVRPLSLMSGRD